MNTIYVKETDFNAKINDGNFESNLYRENGIVYKFLFPRYREEREDILVALYNDPVVNAIDPLALIIDGHSGEFLGYTMKDLFDYIKVSEFISNGFTNKYGEKLSFEKRKKASNSLILFLKDMRRKSFGHHDLTTSNIMISNNKLCVIDVDYMYNDRLRLTHNKHPHIDESYMERIGINVILSILLEYNNIYPYDSKLSQEFKKNPIILSFIGAEQIDLIEEGYTVESINNLIDEEISQKFRYLLKK